MNLSGLEAKIEQSLHDWMLPGASVAIIRNDQTVLERGFGVRQVGSELAVDSHTAFAIGSCTKSITAVVLGLLVDEGKIAWDDPIVKHLPDFALYDPWVTEQVTVRDALSHRIGQQRSLYLYLKGDMPKSEIVHRMRYMQPVDSFRSNFRYGNTQYTLAGELVRCVSGQPWADFVTERIFRPLGMRESYTCYDQMIAATTNFTHGHTYWEDSLIPASSQMIGAQTVIPWQNIGNESAGSVITTAADMTRWLMMLSNHGAPILSSESFEALRHPQIVPRDYAASEFAPFFLLQAPCHFYAYGMGFYLMDYRGQRMMVGGGQIQGMNAAFAVLPELQLGVAVMVNTYHTLSYLALLMMCIDDLLGASDRDWNQAFLTLAHGIRHETVTALQPMIDAHRTDQPASCPLTGYVGSYQNDLLGSMTITQQQGHLQLFYGPGFYGNLEYWEQDTFVFRMTAPTVVDTSLIYFAVVEGKVVEMRFQDGTTLQRQG